MGEKGYLRNGRGNRGKDSLGGFDLEGNKKIGACFKNSEKYTLQSCYKGGVSGRRGDGANREAPRTWRCVMLLSVISSTSQKD